MAAPTALDKGYDGTATTDYSTGAVNVSAGEVVLIWFFSDPGVEPTSVEFSGGAAFTKVDSEDDGSGGGGGRGRLHLYRAVPGAISSETIDVAFAADGDFMGWLVESWSGLDAGGTNGADAIVQVVTKQSSGQVTIADVTLASFGSSDNRPAAAIFVSQRDNDVSPGTDFTEIQEQQSGGSGRTIMNEWRDAEDTNPDFSWDDGSHYAIIGVELKTQTTPTAAVISIADEAFTPGYDVTQRVGIDSYDATATSHDLYRSQDVGMGGDPETNGTLIAEDFDPSVGHVQSTGLDPETTYFYQVVSRNANGDTLSNQINFTSGPARPTNLQAEAGSEAGYWDLTWEDNATIEEKYVVHRSEDDGATWEDAGGTPPDATSFTDPFGANATHYRVVAEGSDQTWSSFSNEAATAIPPDTPTLTVENIGDTVATLVGSAFNDPGGDAHLASQWQVTTDADTGFSSPVIDTGDDTSNLTEYLATGLTASTDYRARVRYKDDSGDGSTEWSEWSDAETFSTTAEAITGTASIVAIGGTAILVGEAS